jgi:AraC-like DNA-binding protein
MRFRNSIKEKQKKRSFQNLTGLAHAMDFFDQSHMIKDFKSLTGHNPKDFFRKIQSPENSSINWIFQ